MKTLKEIKIQVSILEEEKADAYFIWYKDALEWVFNDIINAEAISVATIEKYLQDLINN